MKSNLHKRFTQIKICTNLKTEENGVAELGISFSLDIDTETFVWYHSNDIYKDICLKKTRTFNYDIELLNI